MARTTRFLSIGPTILLSLIFALAIAAGAQPAGAACSDTAERYPMLIGSGYEGDPCDLSGDACSNVGSQYPMLIGSGYEGQPCETELATTALDTMARSSSHAARTAVAQATTSATWHETMLDGSGYESAVVGSGFSGQRHG